MRRLTTLAARVTAVLVMATTTAPDVYAQPLSPGGFGNKLEWVKSVPVDTVHPEMPGYAYVFNETLFLSDGVRGTNIYDVSDPVNPRLLNKVTTPGPSFYPQQLGAYLYYGRITTDGNLLLVPGYDDESPWTPLTEPVQPSRWALYIYDVSNPSSPRRLGKLPTDGPLSAFCILDCRWAYDRGGAIVDLRNPRRPKMAGSWTEHLKFHSTDFTPGPAATDIVEVADGIVLTGTIPMYLLDVTHPTRPRLLARSDGSPYSRGSLAWPDYEAGGVILTSQVGGVRPGREHCSFTEDDRDTVNDSAFATWDGRHWRRSGLFSRIDEYRPKNGTYADGDPAVSGQNSLHNGGCNVSGFDLQPSAGAAPPLVALAARTHGVKLLRVYKSGRVGLHGWFLPHGGNATAVVWVTDRVVYSIDKHRGIDILRYTADVN